MPIVNMFWEHINFSNFNYTIRTNINYSNVLFTNQDSMKHMIRNHGYFITLNRMPHIKSAQKLKSPNRMPPVKSAQKPKSVEYIKSAYYFNSSNYFKSAENYKTVSTSI